MDKEQGYLIENGDVEVEVYSSSILGAYEYALYELGVGSTIDGETKVKIDGEWYPSRKGESDE